MSIPTVTARRNGGAVSMRVTDPTHPQSVAGVVWRYNADESPDGSPGNFDTQDPVVILGSGTAVDGKFFQAEGAVLAHGDNPPSPYHVVVTVLQDGNVLHTGTPDNGEGTVGDDNEPFQYAIRLVLA